MSEYINEQIPQADNFIWNALIGEIQKHGKLLKEDVFYREYKNMVHSKAATMIQDVMGAILKKEKKWIRPTKI